MRHRAIRASACVLALLLGAHAPRTSAAGGEGPTIDGNVRLGWFGSSRDLDARDDLATLSGELSLRQSIGDNQRFDVKVRAIAEDAFGDRRNRVDWMQATWFLRTERVDVRVGKQKVRWGKADGINPTDFFTPIDYTVLLPLEDDRYEAIPAVRADVHVNETDSVSLVAARGFTPTRTPWPKPSPFAVSDDEPSDWQVGVRWLHTGERLDWSLSAFRGDATLPLLHAEATPSGDAAFVRHYARLDALGADIARNFGGFGFRAEAAYYRRRAGQGRQSATSGYMLVAGVDRSLDNWNINVQGVLQHTPDWRDPARETNAFRRLAATRNAILHGQQKRTMVGMTARIAANWRHDTLQTELLLVANASPRSVFARPMLTYALNDRLKLRAGYEHYAGDDDTYFGALKRNRTGFLEWQLSY
jgi:hypothetical protein